MFRSMTVYIKKVLSHCNLIAQIERMLGNTNVDIKVSTHDAFLE
jgi:hypothetical protein